MTTVLGQMDLSTTLTIIGMGASVTASVIVCTWRLSAKATKMIASNASLGRSIDQLSDRFDGHIAKSDTRDEENKREHHALSRCCDANVAAITSITARLARVETQGDNQDSCLTEVDKRLAVVESRVNE